MALWLDLATILTPLGIIGVVVAVASALYAGVTFAADAADHAGIASALWLMGTILSLCSGFVGDWLTPLLALAAYPVSLALVGASRVLLRAVRGRRAATVSQ